MSGHEWREQAACREADPEAFFPDDRKGPSKGDVAEAKAICADCDVMRQCRRWALEQRIDHGIWGGLTRDERRAIHRRQQQAAA